MNFEPRKDGISPLRFGRIADLVEEQGAEIEAQAAKHDPS